jgi:hypothetical protein
LPFAGGDELLYGSYVVRLVVAGFLLGVVGCASGTLAGSPQSSPCSAPSAQSHQATARALQADIDRVNALNLPAAPKPCTEDAQCYAEDACLDGVCIDGQCTGTLRADRDPCRFPLSGSDPGKCYRGQCIAGPVPPERPTSTQTSTSTPPPKTEPALNDARGASASATDRVDPGLLENTRKFLRFYVFGDAAALGVRRFKGLHGLRRRRPAILESPRERNDCEDPAFCFVDMSGLEDFLVLESEGHPLIVFFFASDYPRKALLKEFPKLSAKVERIQVNYPALETALVLECWDQLTSFLGEDLSQLGMEHQI